MPTCAATSTLVAYPSADERAPLNPRHGRRRRRRVAACIRIRHEMAQNTAWSSCWMEDLMGAPLDESKTFLSCISFAQPVANPSARLPHIFATLFCKWPCDRRAVAVRLECVSSFLILARQLWVHNPTWMCFETECMLRACISDQDIGISPELYSLGS